MLTLVRTIELVVVTHAAISQMNGSKLVGNEADEVTIMMIGDNSSIPAQGIVRICIILAFQVTLTLFSFPYFTYLWL